jgi:type II secretory ATPase GspE/PulE/Tfp pilus assembly ATPase PilB-like protein
MEKLAEALPDHVFGEESIELINARGAMIHAGAKPGQRKGRREAVDLFRLLLLTCFRSRASDIHVEPRLDSYQFRLRIDGTMVDVMKVPNQIGIKLTTLVKVVSEIDIAHKNTIQEGHFASTVPAPKLKSGRRRIDFRVSFAPALHGQKLVIRILDPSNAPLRIADLQLPAWMYEEIGAAIRQDAGMVLVSGPTGSGKTTSLYAMVRSIDATRRNVVTIEDPVEIQIENVTQIPVDEAHDKSFQNLLRSVLRQDPDVLLVGEVRDAETARIAMQAAITGHLVFSTVHTKDTVGTIFRLLDLGVEPYLLAQGLHVVLAQRLVRRLCPYCKKPINPNPDQRRAMGEVGAKVQKIFGPKGCIRCLGTGFSGRQAFFELLVFNDLLRDVILRTPTMQDIQTAISGQKFIKLSQAAYNLVAEGLSPFDEVERIVGRER